jgi:transcription antitermination factor NusG
MNECHQSLSGVGADSSVFASSEEANWYAVQTHAKHEKKVDVLARQRGISTFLPLVSQVHRWSDRRKLIESPLFSCYVFVHIPQFRVDYSNVLRINGVIRFVGTSGKGTPIPDWEIENIRLLLSQPIPFVSYPVVTVGQRVRIKGGSLQGLEGVVVSEGGTRKLVVSVQLIQRSVAVTLQGYDVEGLN